MTPRARETLELSVGLVLAVGLTLAAFAAVHWRLAAGRELMGVVFALGLMQAIVHFRFFLRVRFAGSSRDTLLLILFSTLIIALMAGGTVVLLANLNGRMM